MRIKFFVAAALVLMANNVFAALIAVETYLVPPGETPTIKFSIDFSETTTDSWKWSYERGFHFINLDENLHQVGKEYWYTFGELVTTDNQYKDQIVLSWIDWAASPEVMAVKVYASFSSWAARPLKLCAPMNFDNCPRVGGGVYSTQPGYIFLRGDPSIVSEPSGWLAAFGVIALVLRRRFAK